MHEGFTVKSLELIMYLLVAAGTQFIFFVFRMLLAFITKILVAINIIYMYNFTDSRGSFLSNSAGSSAMFVPLHHKSQLYTKSKLAQFDGILFPEGD